MKPAEMLLNIPAEDIRDHFTPLGEFSVCMPLKMLEKYMYPTIKLMQHLQERGGNIANNLPGGGIETMPLFSFYLQGQIYPKERAQEDLEFLKAVTLTSDDDLCDQDRSEVQQVDTAHMQMRKSCTTCRRRSHSLSMTISSSKAQTSYINDNKKKSTTG
jgi:hypothetical protein